jgi:hypothetical protein
MPPDRSVFAGLVMTKQMNDPASVAFVHMEAKCCFPATYSTLKARW